SRRVDAGHDSTTSNGRSTFTIRYLSRPPHDRCVCLSIHAQARPSSRNGPFAVYQSFWRSKDTQPFAWTNQGVTGSITPPSSRVCGPTPQRPQCRVVPRVRASSRGRLGGPRTFVRRGGRAAGPSSRCRTRSRRLLPQRVNRELRDAVPERPERLKPLGARSGSRVREVLAVVRETDRLKPRAIEDRGYSSAALEPPANLFRRRANGDRIG